MFDCRVQAVLGKTRIAVEIERIHHAQRIHEAVAFVLIKRRAHARRCDLGVAYHQIRPDRDIDIVQAQAAGVFDGVIQNHEGIGERKIPGIGFEMHGKIDRIVLRNANSRSRHDHVGVGEVGDKILMADCFRIVERAFNFAGTLAHDVVRIIGVGELKPGGDVGQGGNIFRTRGDEYRAIVATATHPQSPHEHVLYARTSGILARRPVFGRLNGKSVADGAEVGDRESDAADVGEFGVVIDGRFGQVWEAPGLGEGAEGKQ
jgi:hypothetical protein